MKKMSSIGTCVRLGCACENADSVNKKALPCTALPFKTPRYKQDLQHCRLYPKMPVAIINILLVVCLVCLSNVVAFSRFGSRSARVSLNRASTSISMVMYKTKADRDAALAEKRVKDAAKPRFSRNMKTSVPAAAPAPAQKKAKSGGGGLFGRKKTPVVVPVADPVPSKKQGGIFGILQKKASEGKRPEKKEKAAKVTLNGFEDKVTAGRVARFMMFPWIYNSFADTEQVRNRRGGARIRWRQMSSLDQRGHFCIFSKL